MLRQVETRQVWGCQLGVAPRDRGSSEPEPKRLAHLQALLLASDVPECLVTSGRARGWLTVHLACGLLEALGRKAGQGAVPTQVKPAPFPRQGDRLGLISNMKGSQVRRELRLPWSYRMAQAVRSRDRATHPPG